MIPTTYQRKLAELFVEHDEEKARLANATKEVNKRGLADDKHAVANLAHLHERHKRAHQNLKMFLCHIAAHPDWYLDCVMWMVDVQGNLEGDIKVFEDPTVQEMAATDPKSFEAKLIEVGGSQMRELLSLLHAHHFKATDKNLVDDNRWILGVQCTASEADLLCSLIYDCYAEEISMGVLSIRRMPWNMGIVGMTSAAEAREWLRLNPKT